jgi:hypothetical protein
MKISRLFSLLASVLCFATLPAKDLKMINQLPGRLARASKEAHQGWDTGVTATMKNASYKFNEELAAMIKDLVATYYPKDQISAEDITDYLKALYATHRFKQNAGNPSGEPLGTMAGLEVLGEVSDELERTVAEMVKAIAADDGKFDFKSWEKKWEQATK